MENLWWQLERCFAGHSHHSSQERQGLVPIQFYLSTQRSLPVFSFCSFSIQSYRLSLKGLSSFDLRCFFASMIIHGDISPANDQIAETPAHQRNKVLVEYQVSVVVSRCGKIQHHHAHGKHNCRHCH